MSARVPDRLAAALAGRYKLESAIGAGGMATVYLAEDLRHERNVAIKVLKPELAAVLGAERFLTEIKTTANLQHPHILPLFDSGEADSFLFYVMPFVEGESLRERLDRDRQLGVDEAVRIARDVADALDYAHRHGVIHRDIKPANILLHDGRPVVADFGIALAISAAGGGRLTETGLSLGTPHYMSPEQASAERELSARSDVYSLGCVLYEMLAGEPPHTGPNPQSVLMRILTEEPRPVAMLRPTVPTHVAAAVTMAVEKLPADRFESARAFREALEDESFRFSRATTAAGAAPSTAAVAAPAVAGRRAWDARSRVLAAGVAVLGASTAWLAFSRRAPDASGVAAPVVSFQLLDSVPDGLAPFAGPGGWLAYINDNVVHVRAPGALAFSALQGTEGLAGFGALSFSPDGEWIAFLQRTGQQASDASTLRKIPSRGGTSIPLANLTDEALNLRWGEDGWIYVSLLPSNVGLIGRIPETGGSLDTLFNVPGVPFEIDLLPASRGLVFSAFSASGTDARVLAWGFRIRDTVSVTRGLSPRWLPTGHLLYASLEGTLFAVPFDPVRLRTTGAPVPLMDSLAVEPVSGRYDASRAGVLIYVGGRSTSSPSGVQFTLRLDNINGGRERLPLPPSDHWDAKLSPDGRRLAYIRGDQLWVYDLDLGTHQQLTSDGVNHHNPVWSPDGLRIAFSSQRRGSTGVDIYVQDARPGATASRVGGTAEQDYASQWLRDGTILFNTQGSRQPDILLLRSDSASEPEPVLRADWAERVPHVSPDGRWLAYSSSESGTRQLYVRAWPDLTRKTRVSDGDALDGTSFVLWSLDSRTLYYHQGQRIMAADVDSRDSLRVVGRRVISDSLVGTLADIHPDGKRLLVLALEATSGGDTAASGRPNRLIVVTNWMTLLRDRLQPARGR